MPISFPVSLDALTNPGPNDATNVVSHSAQHSNANDAVEALEAKVGVDSSAVTTSHDYKLSSVTGTDKAAPLTSPAFTGTPTGITKTHVGLGSADNTADTAKPVSTAQQTALDLKAPLASPTFTGTVTVPTPAANDNTTKAASTAFVQTELADLIASAPAALDTLFELASAMANDPAFATTMTTALAGKASTTHAAAHQNGGSDEISVAGLSGLLGDSQTPLAHATAHKSGGSDAIKLDELAATTDITTLDATTAKHGLMQKYPGGSSNFLREDGTWAAAGGAGSDGTILRVTTADNTIAASKSLYCVDDYEIGDGFFTELAVDAVLEVG